MSTCILSYTPTGILRIGHPEHFSSISGTVPLISSIMFQFDHRDFLPLDELVKKKLATNTAISVVIPTLNEAQTIGGIVSRAKKDLIEDVPLVDEIIVMDSQSTDATVQKAKAAGARVFSADDGGFAGGHVFGKGAAIWKSLFAARGDVIVCIDADIANFKSHFIYGLVGPFLRNSDIVFAKAYYDRPLAIGNNTYEKFGGRVTEILVRPMLSAFVPEIAHIFQPLSGEYAFRKGPIESIPFSSGYGVEIGLIFDIYKKFGLDTFAQVNMGTRLHRNRTVPELGKMAFGILQTLFRKLEQEDLLELKVPLSEIMVSHGAGGLEETVIREIELPPKTQFAGPSLKPEEKTQ
jgi:glucosyl-3-phosphoglycerate synthase